MYKSSDLDAERDQTVSLVGRAAGVPLHRQIAAALRDQIVTGQLRPDDPLASESELMARYRVARGTVRQAIAALRAEGLVVGSRGKSPVVRATDPAQPFAHMLSFSEWVRSLGKVPGGSIAALSVRPSTAQESQRLALPRGSLLWCLVRVRYVDDDPLMIERAVFPPRVGDVLAQLDVQRESIHAALARQGVTFASAQHVVDALAAPRQDARLLGVPVRTPLLRVRRTGFSTSGEPLEWSEDRYVASRVSFAIDTTGLDARIGRRLEEPRADVASA